MSPSPSAFFRISSQLSSVTQSCLTLCDPMDCSTPGLPVHHQLPWVYPNSCQFLSPHQYMRTPVEVNPDWFLLFSITSSSNILEGHWNLFIAYVNGYLLWWSPESWKLLPSATLQTSCVIDQCFTMCGPWIRSISMNWKLVRNTKSWAPSQTYQKLWE